MTRRKVIKEDAADCAVPSIDAALPTAQTVLLPGWHSGTAWCDSCLPVRCVDSLGEVDADGAADVGGALAGLDLHIQHGSVLVGVGASQPGGAVHVAAWKVGG